MLSPCFPHAFPTLSTRNPPAIPPLSPRIQYAFPYLGGALFFCIRHSPFRLTPSLPALPAQGKEPLRPQNPSKTLTGRELALLRRSLAGLAVFSSQPVQFSSISSISWFSLPFLGQWIAPGPHSASKKRSPRLTNDEISHPRPAKTPNMSGITARSYGKLAHYEHTSRHTLVPGKGRNVSPPVRDSQ